MLFTTVQRAVFFFNRIIFDRFIYITICNWMVSKTIRVHIFVIYPHNLLIQPQYPSYSGAFENDSGQRHRKIKTANSQPNDICNIFWHFCVLNVKTIFHSLLSSLCWITFLFEEDHDLLYMSCWNVAGSLTIWKISISVNNNNITFYLKGSFRGTQGHHAVKYNIKSS